MKPAIGKVISDNIVFLSMKQLIFYIMWNRLFCAVIDGPSYKTKTHVKECF